jgi:hypothetical protein
MERSDRDIPPESDRFQHGGLSFAAYLANRSAPKDPKVHESKWRRPSRPHFDAKTEAHGWAVRPCVSLHGLLL